MWSRNGFDDTKNCCVVDYAVQGLETHFDAFQIRSKTGMNPGGGVLKEFLGGDVPLAPWNP